MNDQRLRLAIFVTLCMTAVYVCAAWLSVREWNLDILDGSWEYGVRQMFAQGLYLGKDVPLTYGPLTHFLAPVIKDGQRPFLLFYVLGALYVFFGLYALRALLSRIEQPTRFTYLALAAFVFSLPLAGFTTFRGELDTGIFFWTIVTWFALFVQTETFPRTMCLAGLMVLAVTGLEMKFSFGVLSTAVLLVTIVSLAKTAGIRTALIALAIFAVANWLVYFALTGSWGFLGFFLRGLHLSSLYAEASALHRPSDASDFRYVLGLLACLNFVIAVGVAAWVLSKDLIARLSMLALALVTSFFLFKMGFVRADQHTLMFYQTLLPILLLLYAVVNSRVSGSKPVIAALCVGFVVFMAGFHYELRVFGSGFGRQFVQTVVAWLDVPVRLVDAAVLQARGFTGEQSRMLALVQGFPNLSRALQELDAQPSDTRRSIAFAPWETMLYHLTPSFSLSVPPTLQVYPERFIANAPELVDRYLGSDRRPDVVVLGPHTIDSRNSVSEFTNWLPLLYRNYRPIKSADGFTVLRRSDSENENRTIQCSKHGPGLFLKGRIQPLGTRDALLSKFATMLFKGPELVAIIDVEDGNGKHRRIACRSYRSQLEATAYFADMPIGDLLVTMNRPGPAPQASVISKVLGAALVRVPAARNLPVCPQEVPIELEFCAPKGFRFSE